jgi:hypothetical protein
VNDHALAVDIAGLEVAKFVAAQSRRIQRCDPHPMLQIRGVIEKPSDLF